MKKIPLIFTVILVMMSPAYTAEQLTEFKASSVSTNLSSEALSKLEEFERKYYDDVVSSITTQKLSCKAGNAILFQVQQNIDEMRRHLGIDADGNPIAGGESSLQKKLDDARERQNSAANRLLGGATIVATGIGGMQLLSGLATESADANADSRIRALYESMRCDYGAGQNVRGGEVGVATPDAGLFNMYNEYRTVAAALVKTKSDLGMAPGIESENIADAATSGLYDNASSGPNGGAFASRMAAMMDETGADAAELAEQRSDAINQRQTGTWVAGAGIVGGVLGDLMINSEEKKSK